TLLELIGFQAPGTIAGTLQMPLEGESFAASIDNASAPPKSSPQYFEMFGHRGLWHRGWKAVSFHPSGTPFENDKWDLFHLDRDFSEVDDLATKEPQRLDDMIKLWWGEAEKHNVLPLDDRFGPRFPRTPRVSTARAISSLFMPAWGMCRPTLRPMCAAVATP